MSKIALLIIIVIAASIVSCINIETKKEGTRSATASIIWALGLIGGYVIGLIVVDDEPTALDVYRDKTELKITSVNGIPTDTVVVFKVRNCE